MTQAQTVETARGPVPADDLGCYIDWFGPGTLDDLKDWHYLHVSQDVLPYLSEHGVTDDQIDAMLVRNPARILRA
jgi:phosphotriesterase-related protein